MYQPTDVRIARDKEIFTVAWNNDSEFSYGFYPRMKTEDGYITTSQLHWASYNIDTGTEGAIAPLINFDDTFWERNGIRKIAYQPEGAGYFSPSGMYVIQKTEIRVAERGRENGKYMNWGRMYILLEPV